MVCFAILISRLFNAIVKCDYCAMFVCVRDFWIILDDDCCLRLLFRSHIISVQNKVYSCQFRIDMNVSRGLLIFRVCL